MNVALWWTFKPILKLAAHSLVYVITLTLNQNALPIVQTARSASSAVLENVELWSLEFMWMEILTKKHWRNFSWVKMERVRWSWRQTGRLLLIKLWIFVLKNVRNSIKMRIIIDIFLVSNFTFEPQISCIPAFIQFTYFCTNSELFINCPVMSSSDECETLRNKAKNCQQSDASFQFTAFYYNWKVHHEEGKNSRGLQWGQWDGKWEWKIKN